MKIKLLATLALTGLLAMQAQAVRITVNADGNPTGNIVSAYDTSDVKDWKLKINGVNPNGQKVVPVDVDWNLDYTFVEGKVTYWTKIYGNYDINLGIASISAQQGGTLNVYTTNTDWASPYGIGLTSNYNPYRIRNFDKTAADRRRKLFSVKSLSAE